MPYRKHVEDDDAQASGPACLHLRSKGMYVTGQVNPGETGHSDGYCWCNQTQNVLGPDDQMVDRAACQVGRTCFYQIA